MLPQVQSFFHDNRERLIAASRQSGAGQPDGRGLLRGARRPGRPARDRRQRCAEPAGDRAHRLQPANRAADHPGQRAQGGHPHRACWTRRTMAIASARPARGPKCEPRAATVTCSVTRPASSSFDPMRLVRLSDAALRQQTPCHRGAFRRQPQEAAGDWGRPVESQAEQKELYQLLECLPPLMRARLPLSTVYPGDRWSGVEALAGCRLHFDLADIAAACNRFFRPILDEELRLLRERGYLDEDWAEAVLRVLAGPLGSPGRKPRLPAAGRPAQRRGVRNPQWRTRHQDHQGSR